MTFVENGAPLSFRHVVQWHRPIRIGWLRVVMRTEPQLQLAVRVVVVAAMIDSTPFRRSVYVPGMRQARLFPDPRPDLTDEEAVAAVRAAIERGGSLSRLAELYLATLCAEHLLRELRGQGLQVVRRPLGE